MGKLIRKVIWIPKEEYRGGKWKVVCLLFVCLFFKVIILVLPLDGLIMKP